MAARLLVSQAAERDHFDIWSYIASDSPAAADRMLERLYRAEDGLIEFPEIGQKRPDIAPGLRHWVIAPYVILYRHSTDLIEIVRVLHGAQDLGALFDR